MKKIFLITFLILFSVPVSALTLWEWYGGRLPSLLERSPVFNSFFPQEKYQGTAEQNTKLVQNLSSLHLGSAIQTINLTDTVRNALFTKINANFQQVANTTTPQIFNSLQQFNGQASSTLFSCYGPCYFGATATSSFSTAGALTLTTPLTVANGGTGSTTLSFGQVLLGSTTNAIGTVNGYGSSGQVLTSTGAGSPPTFQSLTVGLANDNLWTGANSFTGQSRFQGGATTTRLVASSTIANPLILNGIPYATPSVTPASSTIPSYDGSNQLYFVQRDWELLGENSITGAATSTLNVSGIPAASSLRIEAFATTTTNLVSLRFNNDAGSLYNAYNNSVDSNGTGKSGAATYFRLTGLSTSSPTFSIVDVLNLSGTYKLLTAQTTQLSGGKGAGDTPIQTSTSGLYANNTVQITNVQLLDSAGATMGAGTRLRVWGRRD